MFVIKMIDYPDHVMQPSQLENALHTTNDIPKLQLPKNIAELKSFFGFIDVFRRFDPNFARIASLLDLKLYSDQPSNFWTISEQKINSLIMRKDALIHTPSPHLASLHDFKFNWSHDTRRRHLWLHHRCCCWVRYDQSNETLFKWDASSFNSSGTGPQNSSDTGQDP